MNAHPIPAAALLALLALACRTTTAEPAEAPAPAGVEGGVEGDVARGEPADGPAATGAPDGPRTPEAPDVSGWTGALTEADFAALHALSDREEPPARGEAIEVGGAQAYLSLPDAYDAPVPGVVVIHEWWGLNDHIRHWTDRLAANGYAALAVDLYGGAVATTPDEALALVKAVDAEAALAILEAAHRTLVEHPEVRAPRTASIGWCFGGGWSLQLALNEPELDACVIYYGKLVTDVDRLSAIEADVLGIFGSKDESIPLERIADFDEALTAAGKPHTIRMYDANHAFANPSSARYAEDAAAAAWDEVRTFLARNLRGEP